MPSDYLIVNGVTIPTTPVGEPWYTPDLAALLGGPTLRGEDRTVSGQPGQEDYPWIIHSGVYSFPLEIFGHYDETGAPVTGLDDVVAQMEDNVEYLQENLGVLGADGVVTAVGVEWHRRDGTVRSAFAKPRMSQPLTPSPGRTVVRLDLAVAAGVFAADLGS